MSFFNMAIITLINKQWYNVTAEQAKETYYSYHRTKGSTQIPFGYVKMSRENLKRIEFDHDCETGNYDCIACAGDFEVK